MCPTTGKKRESLHRRRTKETKAECFIFHRQRRFSLSRENMCVCALFFQPDAHYIRLPYSFFCMYRVMRSCYCCCNVKRNFSRFDNVSFAITFCQTLARAITLLFQSLIIYTRAYFRASFRVCFSRKRKQVLNMETPGTRAAKKNNNNGTKFEIHTQWRECVAVTVDLNYK